MRAWGVVVVALVACANEQASPKPAPPPPAPRPTPTPTPTPAPAPEAAPIAQPSGSWEAVGNPGDWKGTRLVAVLGDHMFSIEKGDGRLWDTTLASGMWVPIGKAEFGSTTNLFAAGSKLYSIESDGSMYRIDPATGAWVVLGKPTAWKGTRLAVALGGHIFSIEASDGRLWKTDVATGAYTVIGKPDFARTIRMLASATGLYAIEDDGSLYRVDPTDGTRARIGKAGAWKATRLATVLGESMYSIERGDGRLWKTSLATGEYTVVGQAEFGRSRRLLATSNLLYTIEDDGSLYRVYP